VNDVDLFTGLVCELPNPNSELGPTLSCIIADQFERLRKGDMFWYEGDIRSHFTSGVYKTTHLIILKNKLIN
jgi:peroxidase